MKNKLMSALVSALLMVIFGCTNNGDIGDLYGEWVVESYEIADNPKVDNVSNYFWRFQNDIIQITKTLPNNDFYTYTGKWERDGLTLTLILRDKDDKSILEGIGLINEVEEFDIITLSSKRMVLAGIDDGSSTTAVSYSLKKLK